MVDFKHKECSFLSSFTIEFAENIDKGDIIMIMNGKKVFLIENKGITALFAPLKGIILEVDKDEKSRVVELLRRPGFSFEDLLKLFPEIEKNRLLSLKIEDGPDEKKTQNFCPTSVVLFTTFDCQLRCIYCYSRAGEQKVSMNWKVAKAAIDFIINNTKQSGKKECFLEFHGGGEPTFNWPIFRSSSIYFQEKTQRNGLISKINLVTNGMLSKKQVDWIVQHNVQMVQVSLDGMEEIQNFQRPIVGGDRSFAVVYRTIKLFLEKGIEVVIHSVITEKSVKRIPEIIYFLGDNFPGVTVQIEPASPCGRGLVTNQVFLSPKIFVKGFIEAQEIAESFEMELIYSGAISQLTEFHRGFCGVYEPNFVVAPDGLVTACHEVAESSHPLAKFFIYGHWESSSGEFVFDYQKIKRLKNYITENDSKCLECFAKFYCAGDCLAKRLAAKDEKKISESVYRCRINRDLMKYYIFNKLLGSRKEERHERAKSSTRNFPKREA